MARLEDGRKSEVEDLQSEIAKLKKGLKRKSNKKLLSCGNCLVLFILVLIILGVIISYFLAISGLKEIPFLTEKFYQEPQPSYLVDSISLTAEEADLVNVFKEELQSEALRQHKIGDFTVSLDFSEELLSAILRKKISDNKGLDDNIDYLQLAVLDDNLEIYLKTKKNTVWILEVVPMVKDEELDLDLVSFKVGELKIPGFIGNLLIIYPTEKVVNKALGLVDDYGNLENIELFQGRVSLSVFVNNLRDLLNAF